MIHQTGGNRILSHLSPPTEKIKGALLYLVLRGAELNGFAGKDCEPLWKFQVSGVRKYSHRS